MSNMMRLLLVSLLLGSVLLSGYQVLASGPSELIVTEATCQPSDCDFKCDPSDCKPADCRPENCPRR